MPTTAVRAEGREQRAEETEETSEAAVPAFWWRWPSSLALGVAGHRSTTHERAVQGLRRGRAVRDDRAGSGTRTIGQRLDRSRRRPRRRDVSRCAVAQRPRAQPAGGRVPLRSADDAHRRHRQDRARRCLQPAHHVSRRAQHPGDGADLRAAGIRQGGGVHRGGARSRARFATSTRPRPISRAICFRKPTPCRATRRPRSSSA